METFNCIVGAAFCGSAARGEEAYVFNQGRKRIYSDIDFIIVTKSVKDIKEVSHGIDNEIRRAKENKIIKEVTDEHFKFSYSIYPYKRLKYLDKRFIHFETKCANNQFYGQADVIKGMPDITISNLNWAELLTIPLHRMINVIAESCNMDSLYKYYLICRNILDILTVIFPFEGYLIPTYGLRLQNIDKLMNSTELRSSFNLNGLIPIMNYCYRVKLFPQLYRMREFDYIHLLDIFIDNFKSLKSYLGSKRGQRMFIIDKRAVFRSLKYGSISGIKRELSKPRKLLRLYKDCITFLENYALGNLDQQLLFMNLERYKEMFPRLL